MQGSNSRQRRDPYFYTKVICMALASAIVVLTVLKLLLPSMPGFTTIIIFVLGIIMCALTGIMELAKNDRLFGYACSILAGLITVALIIWLVSSWWGLTLKV